MAGSGGGSYFPSRPERLHELIRKARVEAEQKRLETQVNEYIHTLLMTLNERDAEKVRGYIEEIEKVLEKGESIEKFLLGGSVAKHTYVDGLSDIDALVVLDRDDLAGRTPQEVLNDFHQSIKDRISFGDVKSVEKGEMAVTVKYRDETVIQLLPALRVGRAVSIPETGGKEWKQTNPQAFQRQLTKANGRLNNMLVPTIKLTKSIIASFPSHARLTGYHVESLCLEAVKGYQGPKTILSLLTHVFEAASKKVLAPITDVTGQSRAVDVYLGKSKSSARKVASDSFATVWRKMNAARSLDQWKSILED